MSAPFDFKSLADDARDELLADPILAAIPSTSGSAIVTSDDPKDIDTEIQNKLNQIGLGILVLQPALHVTKPVKRGPYFDKIYVVVKIYENPTVNRDRENYVTSGQVGGIVCGILHGFFPPSVNESYYVVESIPVVDADYNVWQVTLATAAGIAYARPAIAPLVATPSAPGGGNVVLSCATPGAAIFYTLDGTYPSPSNPSSHLFVQAQSITTDDGSVITTDAGTVIVTGNGYALSQLNIAPGTLLRARAWLAGYAPTTPPEINVQY
jgi:hypothetical protein